MQTETTRYIDCTEKPSESSNETVSIALLCLVLFVVTALVYAQVGNHPFISLDDYDYIINNPHVANGITRQNISWAFTSVDYTNWQPVTWLSHMADAELYGMDPRGHHLTNVFFHALTALIIFLLFFRLTGSLWPSYIAAALFALHPLHVESVAWVAERKDVLSAFFCFLTLLMYTRYAAKQKRTEYILTLFFFVLGLMSKPMLVTLPLIMLLLDFWPLNRFRYEEAHGPRQLLVALTDLIKEKIPFFLCSIISSIITVFVQNKAGAVIEITSVSFSFRIENALISYLKYIGKTLWPWDLAVFYPYPATIPLWQSISSLCILVLLSVSVTLVWRRYPYLAVGWFWFIITLIPVIGIIQVGGQAMADRYSYIPVTGLFIMAAWGLQDLTNGMQHQRKILVTTAGSALLISAVLTWQQLSYWRNSISLYRHTLQVTADNANVHYFLGNDLKNSGNLDDAILEYQEALRIEPNPVYLYRILGILALKNEGGLVRYLQELQINPNDSDIHYNIGAVLESSGYLDTAIYEYREALRLDAGNKKAYGGLESAFARKRMQTKTTTR